MSTWWIGEEQLKEEQLDVLDIEPDTSFLLTGPPGSGKTNILLLRANHLWLSNTPNLAVLVFTKTLQRFIAMGADQYDFPQDRIMTSRRWQLDLLAQYSVTVPSLQGLDFDGQRELLNEMIQTELIEKRGVSQVFDAVLIDEAHDYSPDEIKTFRQMARVLVASADNRQKIYQTPDSMETLRDSTQRVIALTHHYRIGRKICRVADAAGAAMPNYDPMLDNCQYDETAYPSDVVAVQSGTVEQQAEAVVDGLGLQLDSYPEEMIGVLAPTNGVASRVYDVIAASAHAGVAVLQSPDDHPAFTSETRISIGTIHSAKGLEFRAVHLVDADSFHRASRQLVFTGVTRAKTSVQIHYNKSLPGYVESAVRGIQAARPIPGRAELFGKKRKR